MQLNENDMFPLVLHRLYQVSPHFTKFFLCPVLSFMKYPCTDPTLDMFGPLDCGRMTLPPILHQR